MKGRGFFGICCINMKNELNYGTLFRTAQMFDADFLFLIGRRFKHQPTDTMKSYKHIPIYEYKNFADFNEHKPYGCQLIGVEMTESAQPIKNFVHPKQCCYLLGAEDTGLTKEAI